jgi:8-oxo-dGTP pyrophosphatase MutT (NUDIX family)
MSIGGGYFLQAAAIPIRAGRICLVTSRNRKSWVVPKGCSEPGKTLGEIALQEAWEEAGLVGILHPEPAGSYIYKKAGRRFHVTVFRMLVTKVTNDFPEKHRRERRWIQDTRALDRVGERGLRQLVRTVLMAQARLRAAA